MSDMYVGEIRLFAGNYAPEGWAFCNGQELPISGNEILFSVIGVTYGGNGTTTFNLPDLRGRVPVHMGTNPQTGTNFPLGSMGGSETVTLVQSQLPAHTHVAKASNLPGTVSSPTNAIWAHQTSVNQYSSTAPNASMSPMAINPVGGNQPHENRMPIMALNFIIALNGIYPPQS